ncbi:MAG: hypothetical protein A3I68_03965 [Candidatus Melainabacteria bacterium RIFCSPLOWO2_02_FULL_35_15]|nr:MAG: hypothetical protein A3F80_01475 [Candidatus Melainabacteria bacterium RIFCSPLOWO2_12_FULL_35_11]OGI13127.1 MAG: hypothetical protein A3I68_03965 [Candidatus Melainabacteria bacterium RIFCSPLOWO2_02_FULL_35_15]
MENQLFKNKYRIKSIRLKHWDYSSCGAYYVTICTKDRECFLGEITNGKMLLSNIGQTVEKFWMEIPKHYPNVQLDEFVIMPDHLHGLIFIDDLFPVEACHGMSLQTRVRTYNKFSKPVSQSLSMIINQFKSAIKRWCNKNGFTNFAWQSRFYESIIRNEKHLNAIREYTINNPLKFELNKKSCPSDF